MPRSKAEQGSQGTESAYPYVSKWLTASGFTTWQARCLTIMFEAAPDQTLLARLEAMETELSPVPIQPPVI